MTTNDQLALLEIEGRIARLTLNRPDARNALSIDLLEAIHARLDELAQMAEPTVCIITGAGKCLCAGMDLKAALHVPGAPAKLLSSIAEMTIKVRRLPQVTIARINGAAIGGGAGLMCVCDLGFTHPEAKLGYPEVDIGVCPAVVAPWLVQRIGAGKARQTLLKGGTMRGEEAAALGMVTACVPMANLDQAVEETATRLAAAAPGALRATKTWLNDMEGERLIEQVRAGAELSARVVETPEARAALEKVFSR